MENKIENEINLKESLFKTASWAKYAAVLTFIGLGIEFSQVIFGALNGGQSFLAGLFKFFFTSIFSLITAINLYNFSKFVKHSVENPDSKYLYQAFRHLKIFFTVLGISIIILSSLLILSLVAFIVKRYMH